ncbi:MAG: hypothetical protein ACK4KW_13210 [Gemmobacter sp.]
MAAALLPSVPAVPAAALCLIAGAAVALPEAVGAAVRRGHGLAVWRAGGTVRQVLGGGGMRVLLLWPLGTLAATVLLLRLGSGGPAVWLAAAAVVPVTLGTLALASRALRHEAAGLHGARAGRRVAAMAGVLAALVVAAVAGLAGTGPDLAVGRPAASALVAEAAQAMRLLDGAEAALFGQVAALGLMPGWLEAAVAVLIRGGTGWAVASLALAAAIDPDEWRRALGPASDAPVAPAASQTALAAAGVVASAILAGAVLADARLGAVPAEVRPVARVQIAVDRIGDSLHASGGVAAVAEVAAGARDAAILSALPGAVETAFDAMAANVDPFLDRYYSLPAEYLRLLNWVTGDLEASLARDLTEALMAGQPTAPVDALLAEAKALRAETEQLQARLDESRIDSAAVNPGRMRIIATTPAVLPELRSPGLTTEITHRMAVAGVGATLGAVVAGRIVARLVGRGAVAGAAKAVGLIAGIAIDLALVKAEEALNREAFRAEILAEIERARTETLAALR